MFQPVAHFSLYPFNTFGMDVHASYFDILSKEEELLHLKEQEAFKNGLLILGGGSNILFTQDVPQWVLRNEIRGIEEIKEDEEYVWLRAGAGEVWHGFVLYCVNHGYGGVENLSLIPGTVGASPIQNIGAYGVEIKDVMDSVRFFDLEKETFEIFTAEQCQFGYRDSIFKRSLKGRIIITSVVFRLRKKPVFNVSYGNIQQELDIMGIKELSVKSISDAVIRIRSAKLPDPKEIGNAGSFFKNPEVPEKIYDNLKEQYPSIPGFKVSDGIIKIPAGWLIEQCSWKGFRENDYGVHRNQALVLVNYGKAKGKDIALLSEKIMASVQDRFNIALEREVQII
ncbi:MAG: UDP-N-acetylmuramate dehydrogenase [Taibaiella sp.]|jgi:UDP-N-acetylmuramate dehydrogenase